jgi:hypothetical protein
MEFRISDTFTDSLAKLTGEEQKSDVFISRILIRKARVFLELKSIQIGVCTPFPTREGICRQTGSVC